jgi:glutamate dehydrogenase
VAGETGMDVETVAPVHFRLGSELGLHWIRDRVVELPRADRWAALARAALRDDLYGLHRSLTAEVLKSSGGDGGADEQVSAWIDGNDASERFLATLADVRVGRVYDLTTLPVIVRELRNLIQAPRAATAEPA